MKMMKFALGFMPHRRWGNILQAQFLEKPADRAFFSPGEYIQNDEKTAAYQRLSPMQREVVQLLDAYNDRKLKQLFSREKTVKQFHDKVDEARIRDHIRPYIEKYLYRALEIARDCKIDVFVKEKNGSSIFPEDFISLERQAVLPYFYFRYDARLSYALKLTHKESRLEIKDTALEVVSSMPLAILLGRSLYFVRDIDARKLKPFLTRDEVLIPPHVEQKYFGSFVRNTLRDYPAGVEGFERREVESRKKARLTMEQGMHNRPVWILEFQYREHVILPDSSIARFVDYRNEGGRPLFFQYQRDWEWEEEMKRVLRECGLGSRDERNYHLKTAGAEPLFDAINFMNQLGTELRDAGFQLRQRLQQPYFIGPVNLEIESRDREDWFDIYGKVSFGEHELPFLALKDHILQGKRCYPLPNGELAILPREWFSRYRSLFEFGRIKEGRMWIHKQHFSLVEGAVREFHSETMEKLEKLKQLGSIPAQPLPDQLRARLRDYQYEGYKWMCFLQNHGFGGCLADDMGLGKTLQAIAVLLRAKQEGFSESPGKAKEDVAAHASGTSPSAKPAPSVKPPRPARPASSGKPPRPARPQGPGTGQLSLFSAETEAGGAGSAQIEMKSKPCSLIVVPASLTHNWYRECSRFAPDLRLCMHLGGQRNKMLSNFPYYDVVISTYHTVRQDIEKMADFPFYYVILDESQMIKNPSSKLYQAISELNAAHRLVLTGTPIENSLTDLWSQINFVNPGLLGSLSFFRNSFVHPIEKWQDEAREEKLKQLIRPFVLRRTKMEVAKELPALHEQVCFCDMSDAQRRLYDEEKSRARNAILENIGEVGMDQSSIMLLQALTRLRQIANHPALLEDEEEGLDSGKFTEVLRNVENVVAEGHKVLIFSSFVRHLELFRKVFEERGLHYAWLTGSQTRRQRDEAVRDFQENERCRLFLISLKAGGTGLNLTAAGYVFILDPWWNPAAEMQALNRAHRIGQENKVFVYRFISSDTIEEKIQRLQSRKKKLADSFIRAGNPLKELSEAEVLELFK
ncbi:MAG: hypothetical protein CSA96_02030 [Bacteroidetes bacterium]|nr:MAG: hypothetical protein CSA96_02030 [Bacteroidota bacterium]